jgi:uncharacterized membrane protein
LHHQLRGHQSHAQVVAAAEISMALVALEVQVVVVTAGSLAVHQTELQEPQILAAVAAARRMAEILLALAAQAWSSFRCQQPTTAA